MGPPELMVLSLGLSVVVAGLGWAGGRGVERMSADPRLRDGVWAAALALPALPPLAVGLMLLTPAPVREISLVTGRLPAALAPAPVATAVAPPQALALDPTMAAWVVLGVAVLLTAVRLTTLSLRAGRLLRIIRQAEAPDPTVTAMVESAARDLAIRAPRVGVSPAASEALLASLGRVRLILPIGLGQAREAEAAGAVIAHELAHLKRGDHRAVWMEEALLVTLAFNPLLPVLRARRAAAREEACDALALEQAAPDIRRAYARSLIEALRDRAGPHASGGLPALTFTGAGRTTAMRRLKAVLNPAPAAGRGLRLTAFGLAGLIALLGGAGSLAVAGEREAVVVINAAAPVTGSEAAAERAGGPAPAALAEQSRTVDLGPDTRTLLNGAPLPEGLPMWAVAAERVDVRTNERPRAVNLILAFTGTTPVSVDGHRMPDGFPVSGVSPEAVARVETTGGHVMYTLKPEAEVRSDRMDASRERAAARMATDTARSALSPEQQARYRGTSARQYQALCTSSDPGDEGFCSGVIFGVLGRAPENGVCAPATVAAPGASGMELNIFVEIGKREVAAMRPNADEGAYEFARRALERAYPCDAAQNEREVVASVPVTLDYGGQLPTLLPGETLALNLRGQVGDTRMAMNMTFSADAEGRAPDTVVLPLTRDYFPTSGGPHAFELSAAIGVGEATRLTAAATTLRLAAGSEASAQRLRPTLSFR